MYMCVNLYICMCKRVCLCMYVHEHLFIYVPACIYVFIHVYFLVLVCDYIFVNVWVYNSMFVYVCICTNIYVHMCMIASLSVTVCVCVFVWTCTCEIQMDSFAQYRSSASYISKPQLHEKLMCPLYFLAFTNSKSVSCAETLCYRATAVTSPCYTEDIKWYVCNL